MARSYRDVESAQIPLAEAVKEAAHSALSLLALAGGAVPAAAGDEPNDWQFEQSGPTGTPFQISCIGPTLPTTLPAEVIRPADIAKDRPFVGTWRLIIKAPILVLDIYWQAGKPLRIMTFANGDWQQELASMADVMHSATSSSTHS